MDWLTGLGIVADTFNRNNSYSDISHIREELEHLNRNSASSSSNEELSELTYILRKIAEAQGIKLESKEERMQRENEKRIKEYKERKAKEEQELLELKQYQNLYDEPNNNIFGAACGICIALAFVAAIVFGLTKFNSYAVNKEKQEMAQETLATSSTLLTSVETTKKTDRIDNKKRINRKIKKKDIVINEAINADEVIAQPEPPKEEENKSFDVVEEMPQFPGGPNAMFEYLDKNLKYPVVAEENGVQGRVIVTFVVERDGSLSDVKVVKSADPSLDIEAKRLVRSMPHWIPGKQNGNPVRVKYTVPVRFNLI